MKALRVASHGGLWDKAATLIKEVARVPKASRWPAGFSGGQRTSAFPVSSEAAQCNLLPWLVASQMQFKSCPFVVPCLLATENRTSLRQPH